MFSPFAARSARVKKFDPPYALVMFLRVQCRRERRYWVAGGGRFRRAVEVSVDPQPVFRSSDQTGYVGDVSLKLWAPTYLMSWWAWCRSMWVWRGGWAYAIPTR